MTQNRQCPGLPTGGQFAATDRREPAVQLPAPAPGLAEQIADVAGNAFIYECHPDRLEMWACAESDLGLFIRSGTDGGLEAKVGYGHDLGTQARDAFTPCTPARLERELLDLDEFDGWDAAQQRVDLLVPLLLAAAEAQFPGR